MSNLTDDTHVRLAAIKGRCTERMAQAQRRMQAPDNTRLDLGDAIAGYATTIATIDHIIELAAEGLGPYRLVDTVFAAWDQVV